MLIFKTTWKIGGVDHIKKYFWKISVFFFTPSSCEKCLNVSVPIIYEKKKKEKEKRGFFWGGESCKA